MPNTLDISKIFGTNEGRMAFSAATQKELSEFTNITRTVLRIDKVPEGAIAVYNGATDDRIYAKEQEMSDNISFRIQEIQHLVDTNSLKSAMLKQVTIPQQEDEVLFEHLKALEIKKISYKEKDEIPNSFIEMLSNLESKDLYVKYVLANSRLCSYIKEFHGITILRSDLCEYNEVYVFPEPEFSGVLAIRTDLQCVPADNPSQLRMGWVLYEVVGIFIHPQNVLRFNLFQKKYNSKWEFFNATWKEENEVPLIKL